MKLIIAFILSLLLIQVCHCQIVNQSPGKDTSILATKEFVSWDISVHKKRNGFLFFKHTSKKSWVIVMKATIADGFFLASQDQPNGALLKPIMIFFNSQPNLVINMGKSKEHGYLKWEKDINRGREGFKYWGGPVIHRAGGSVVFTHKLKLHKPDKVTVITGGINYVVYAGNHSGDADRGNIKLFNVMIGE